MFWMEGKPGNTSSGIYDSVNIGSSSVGDRVFIDDQACRSLLYKYAKTATCNVELRNFMDSDVDVLVTMLTTHCPVLADLLNYFDKLVPCPSACAELLTALSSLSPVCALILPTPSIICLVQNICDGVEVRKIPEQWQLLHENVPILYRLMCNHTEMSLPQEYRKLVKEMLLKAQLPFLRNEKHPLFPPSNTESHDCYAYFPSLPKYCSRPSYRSDKRPINDVRVNEFYCTKKYSGHPSLLPGIFTFFCPHGM